MGSRKRPSVIASPAVAGRSNPNVPQDFLLEIGCEELPADYMPGALDWDERSTGLSFSANRILSELGVVWKGLQCFGTPRRLVLCLKGVESVVKKKEKGPPAQVAFDAQGKPTRAAEAFAQRHGLKVPQLVREQTPKGEVVYAEYSVPVTKVLSEAIHAIIGGIAFPKTMRWDETGVRFARPVRWLLVLYGAQVVPVTFGLLRAGRQTYPNRRLGSKPVVVKNVASYFSLLSRMKVQLQEGRHDPAAGPVADKKEMLYRKLETEARKLGGRLQDEAAEEFEWLLNTVTFLAEDPVVAVGSFQKVYLDLPTEVLATSMAKHLKLFSLREKDSERLLPKFLAVLEGKPAKPAMVMAHYDRIIEARFTDARFFYREDTKTRLEAKVPELAKVAFHEKLGTVGDRVPRLEQLINGIGKQVKLPVDVPMGVNRAARLCKADLVTQMVREFPSLQGAIGAHYAHHDDELETVSSAIHEQYRPKSGSDTPPQTPLGAVLSLADRVDALVGYFGVGLKPTGSADPYGLRRQALGLVRILIEPPQGVSFVGLSIDRLFDEGIQSWGPRLSRDPESLKKELRAFLRERFEWLAFVHHRIDRELIAAVLAAGDDDWADAWARLKVLYELWQPRVRQARLLKAAKVAERTGRMVKSVKDEDDRGQPVGAVGSGAASDSRSHGLGRVNPEIFKEPLEKKLWEAWNRVAPVVEEQIQRRDYAQAVETYGSLYPEIHQFFEAVFVMDENKDVRANRLALIHEIYRLLSEGFADLSKLSL